MKKHKIFALLVTIAFLILIFYKMDFVKLFETFKLFNFKYMWIIVPAYILTLYLRGIRWKALFLDNKKYNSLHLGEVFTVGSMLNIFLPARAGDVYRAYYLGENKNEKKMKVFGSIILERTQDGICVFLILLFAVMFYCSNNPIILNLAYIIGFIFLGSMLAFYLMFKFNKIDFVCEKIIFYARKLHMKWICGIVESINKHANNFMEGFEVLNSFKYTFKSALMSAIIWLIECYVAYLIIHSFDLPLGFSSSLFVISLISFSTMLPSTSVFLGPYQYAYILALGLYGIDKSTALAVSTIHQSILMLILTAIGSYYLIKFNFSLNQLKNIENSSEETPKDETKLQMQP